ncbi:MAG: cell division protein FtsA [Pseudomonadota bacterium]
MANAISKKRSQLKDARIVAAIDIGGAKASCVIASLAPLGNGSFEPDVLGVGQCGERKASDQKTSGVRAGQKSSNRSGTNGQIGSHSKSHSGMPAGFGLSGLSSGLGDVERNLRGAVDAAERMAGEQIKSAFVAVPGRQLKSRRIGVDLPLSGGIVTREDIADCLAEAKRNQSEGFAPLHAQPIRHILDGEALTGSAIGLAGDILTTEVLSLGVRETTASNVEGLMHRCGLEPDAFVAAPYAAAEATLIDDEKELGAVLIDMGARHTDYAVYERGSLTAVGGIALGSEHITRDIAQVFSAPIADAERAKIFHGSALSAPGDEHRLIEFPQLGVNGEIERQSRAELSEVIASRLEEIFEKTLEAMAAHQGVRGDGSNEAGVNVRRVVLTGGGSLLLGAAETAERVIGAKARLGRPVSLMGAPAAACAPQFASVVGVVQYAAFGARGVTDADTVGATIHGLGRIPGAERLMRSGSGRALSAMGSWLRQNF